MMPNADTSQDSAGSSAPAMSGAVGLALTFVVPDAFHRVGVKAFVLAITMLSQAKLCRALAHTPLGARLQPDKLGCISAIAECIAACYDHDQHL